INGRNFAKHVQIEVCPACATAQELQAVLWRPEFVAHRNMDDASSNKLAGVSRHQICLPAWLCRLFRAVACAYPDAICRRLGGPVEPPSGAEGDATSFHAGIVCAGSACAWRLDQYLANYCAHNV